MNWEIVAAIGEFIGGFAVLLTIIYLAVQVRQAKQAVRSNIRQQTASQSMALTESVYNSEFMPVIFRKIRENEELEPIEIGRFMAYLTGFHRHFEAIYYLAQTGDLPMEVVEGNVYGLGKGGWVDNQYGREHWETSRMSYSHEYREWVDQIVLATPADA
jgi:hypothetical protein